jgi:hypothetical protein
MYGVTTTFDNPAIRIKQTDFASLHCRVVYIISFINYHGVFGARAISADAQVERASTTER